MGTLSETAERILSELEEAGEEDVVTMINTITTRKGTSDEVNNLTSALHELIKADLIRMSLERGDDLRLTELSVEESIRSAAKISDLLSFDPESNYWKDTRRTGPPYKSSYPYIINTKKGEDLGFKILDRRGYQWWRDKI